MTNCSNTLHNTHVNTRQNITRTRAKRKAGYFSVAHPALNIVLQFTSKFKHLSLYCLRHLTMLSIANITYFRCYRRTSTYDWRNDNGGRKLKYRKTSLYSVNLSTTNATWESAWAYRVRAWREVLTCSSSLLLLSIAGDYKSTMHNRPLKT